MANPDAIIVGAGPAGLACAACLGAAGLSSVVLEQAETVGAVWRRHYDRLHLHTDRDHSGLPHLPMPRTYPTYPSRAQVVAYLERYADQFDIKPVFGTRVRRAAREDAQWHVAAEVRGGAEKISRAPVLVIATGTAGAPYRPTWPGMDTYRGGVVHSSEYRNPTLYAGKRTLVVGFGNSGGEIALDLANAGVDVALAVRGPIQVLPRDLLGLPILSWAIFYRHLPARLVDWINAPVLRLAVGRVDDLGLRLDSKGPRRRVEEDGRVPIFDIGVLAKIRDGAITTYGGIDRFTADGVIFRDGAVETFDAVILATGFRPDLRGLLPEAADVLDQRGLPLQTGRTTREPGLYFCGQTTSATGQLREIGIEARRIAALVAFERASSTRAERSA